MATTTIAVQQGKRVRPRLGRIAAIGALALLAVAVIAYFGISAYVADRVSRPERKAVVSSPAQYGLTYEDVSFNSTVDNIPLSGWLVDSPGDKVIIMMHGRDQNRESDEAYIEKASIFATNSYDVLMFDFRAHGMSGGERYAFGQWETRDVAGAVNFLKGRGYTQMGTYAVSLGAGVSLLAAPENPEIKALWVDSPFSNLASLLDEKIPKSSGLPAFFNPGILFMGKLLYGIDLSTVNPARALAGLGDRAVYQVHSREGDTEIPLSHAYEIEEAGAGNPNFVSWIAPGKGHVAAYTNNKQEYTMRMLHFYNTYLGGVD